MESCVITDKLAFDYASQTGNMELFDLLKLMARFSPERFGDKYSNINIPIIADTKEIYDKLTSEQKERLISIINAINKKDSLSLSQNFEYILKSAISNLSGYATIKYSNSFIQAGAKVYYAYIDTKNEISNINKVKNSEYTVVSQNGDIVTIEDDNGNKFKLNAKYLILKELPFRDTASLIEKATSIKQIKSILEKSGFGTDFSAILSKEDMYAIEIAEYFSNKNNARLNKDMVGVSDVTDIKPIYISKDGNIGIDKLRQLITQETQEISLTNNNVIDILRIGSPLEIVKKTINKYVNNEDRFYNSTISTINESIDNTYKFDSLIKDLNILGENDNPENFNDIQHSEQVLNSEKTILSNEELKYWNKNGVTNPKILVASEHSDPAYNVEKILDIINGKRKIHYLNFKKVEITKQEASELKNRGLKIVEKNGKLYRFIKTDDSDLTGNDINGLYIITKHDGLPMLKLLQTKIPKLIHFSITTLGGSKYEPSSMKYNDLLDRIKDYIAQGLDPNSITIRIDPIVPNITKESDIENVIRKASEMGIKRIRFSIMDVYNNTINRFKEIDPDYKIDEYYDSEKIGNVRHAKLEIIDKICDFMLSMKEKYNITLSTCAESINKKGISNEGCLSVSAVNQMLGTSMEDNEDNESEQRNNCHCFGGKVDALAGSDLCYTHCAYCYMNHKEQGESLYDENGKLKVNKFTQSRQALVSVPQNRVSGKNQYGFTQIARKEIIDKLGKDTTSIDMVEAGYRTRTTRSATEAQKYNLSVGDIFEQYGVAKDGTTKRILTRVTAIYGQDDPRFLGNWNKEGWTNEGIEDIKRLKNGAQVIEFELLHNKNSNNNSNIEDFVLHSGGANGSDILWGSVGKEYGLKEENIKHYYHNDKTPYGNTLQTDEDFKEGVNKAKEAAMSMGRVWVDDYEDLMARNWNQVKYSDAVFAIGHIIKKGERNKRGYIVKSTQVDGGTGYAVQMAINSNKPVYVYDYVEKSWYKNIGNDFEKTSRPILTKNFAGIGTRDIENDVNVLEDVQKEVRSVFNNTINYLNKDNSIFDNNSNTIKEEFVNTVENFSSIEIYTSNKELLDELSKNTNEISIKNQEIIASINNNISNKKILLRSISNNTIISASVNSVTIDSDGVARLVLGIIKKDNTKSNISNLLKDIITQTKTVSTKETKETKRQIKYKIGSQAYSVRVNYLSKIIKLTIKNFRNGLIKEGKITRRTPIKDTFNYCTPQNIKDAVREFFKKDILSEEKIKKTKDIYKQYNLFSRDSELESYVRNISKNKSEANKLILEYFDEFFEDALKKYSGYYGLSISISENKINEKETEDFSQDENDKIEEQNDNIVDKEYDHKEHWQIEIHNMIDTASAEVKDFISDIPKRDKNGKPIFNEIGEVDYLDANEIFNTLQDITKDCFTWSEMESAIKNYGNRNPDYKYILEKLNLSTTSKDGKVNYPYAYIKNELFTLLTTEELFYSTYYTKNKSEDKFEQEKAEESGDEINDSDILVKKGYLTTDENIVKDTVKTVELNMMNKVPVFDKKPLNSLDGHDFKILAGKLRDKILPYISSNKKGNKLYQISEHASSFSKNEIIRIMTGKGELSQLVSDIHLILNNIGYKISFKDVQTAMLDIYGDSLPAIKVVDALNKILYTASKFISFYDCFEKLSNKQRDDFEEAVKTIVEICPVSSLIKRSSTVYVNNNLYPKFKNLSFFGETIKYLKTNNKERRAEWVENNYKKIKWFYNKGNVELLRNLFKDSLSYIKAQNDVAIINQINKGFSDGNLSKINNLILQLGINTKKELISKINLSDGIEKYSDIQLIEPHWNNKVIGLLMQENSVFSSNIKRERVLSFDKKDFESWSKKDLMLLQVEKYFSHKRNNFSEFLVPNYSDAMVCEFVTLPKSGSLDECVNSLYETFVQEVNRISMINERDLFRNSVYKAYNLMIDAIKTKSKPNISDVIIKACFDDFYDHYSRTGKLKQYFHNKYFSFPIQNIEDVEEIKVDNDGKLNVSKKKTGRGKSFQFLGFLNIEDIKPEDLNNKEIEAEVKSRILKSIEKEATSIAYKLYKARYSLSRFSYSSDNGETSYLHELNEEKQGGIFDAKSQSYVHASEKLKNFVADNMCATAALIQLLSTDIAYYNGIVDFQKRFKEVYAGTKRLNTEYDENTNKYAKENQLMLEITDAEFDKSFDILNVLAKSNISEEQKSFILKEIVSEYKDVNGTDGQSLRTLSSMRAIMSMSNEWDESIHGVLFDKLQKGQPLTTKELKVFINPRKPFSRLNRFVNSKTTLNTDNSSYESEVLKVSYQIKNSEFLMMYLYSQIDTSRDSDSAMMYALNKFMVDNGIDVINYNSAIKVGGQAAFNTDEIPDYGINVIKKRNFDNDDNYLKAVKEALRQYSTRNNLLWKFNDNDTIEYDKTENGETKKIAIPINDMYEIVLKTERGKVISETLDKLYNFTMINRKSEEELSKTNENDRINNTVSSANLEIVKVIPFSTYGTISEEHEHYNDRKQKVGTQLVRLLTSNNIGLIKIGDKKYSNSQIFNLVTRILLAKTKKHYSNVEDLMTNANKLLSYVKSIMMSDSKYSEATINCMTSIDDYGNPTMLGDNAVRNQVESILNSFIRKEINDIKLDGGTCTQVTAVGTENLSVIYDIDEEGKPYVKYWEAIAPLPFKSLLSRYMDKNGMLSILKFKEDKLIDDLTKNKILEVLGCRIPTESKHSIQHIKIVNFSAPQNGSVVFLPYQITKTSGADFDIDHLYMWRYSFNWVEKTEVKKFKKPTGEIYDKEVKYKVPVYADYHNKDGFIPENLDDLTEKQLNNYLLDVFVGVLEASNNFTQELSPSSFNTIRKQAYIGYLINNESSYLLNKLNCKTNIELYEKLQHCTMNELKGFLDKTTNILGVENQLRFFEQNSLGKGQLGIMAVNNVFLSLLQHLDVNINKQKLPVINNYSHGSFNNILHKYSKNDYITGTLSAKIISEMLTAAPDSAKDPVLAYLGISKHVQNALLAAVLLGYDIKDISLLFNNNIIKDFFSDNFEDNEMLYPEKLLKAIKNDLILTKLEQGYYDESGFNPSSIPYIGNNFTISKVDNKVELEETRFIDLQTKDLLYNDSSFENVSIDTKEKLLITMYKFFEIGQSLFELSTITREDSTSGTLGSSVSDMLSKYDKIITINNKMKDEDNPIQGDFLGLLNTENLDLSNQTHNPLGFIGTQYYYGIYKPLNLYRNLVPEMSDTFLSARRYLNSILRNGYADTELLNKMTYEYIKYNLYQTEFFGSEDNIDIKTKAKKIVNNMWEQINTTRKLYKDASNNLLLNSLVLNDKGIVTLPDAGRIEDEDKKALTNAWEELINSPYSVIRSLGYSLIKYSFYRNGLMFAPDGFGHLCPDIRSLIPEYTEAINYATKSKEDGISFISQFIRNNADIIKPKTDKITFNKKDNEYYFVSSEDDYEPLIPNKITEGSEGDFTVYDSNSELLMFTEDANNIFGGIDVAPESNKSSETILGKYGNMDLTRNCK